MIDQHTQPFWLRELNESAHFMESLYREKNWNTELEFKTEKAVFIGAYSIRKLKENNYLNCKISGMNTQLFSFNTRQGFDPDENENWVQGYDHMNGKNECLSLDIWGQSKNYLMNVNLKRRRIFRSDPKYPIATSVANESLFNCFCTFSMP